MPTYEITMKTVNVELFIAHEEFDSEDMANDAFVCLAYRQIANDFPMILTFEAEWFAIGFLIKLTHKGEL